MKLGFNARIQPFTVVDSCGWIAYFKGEGNASFFESALLNTKHLIVPALSIYEVCKNVLTTRDEVAAKLALEIMQQGQVVDLNPSQLFDAAVTAKMHGLHMGDAIIWQTAHVHGATLYTQDAGLSGMPNVMFKQKQ